MELTRIVLNGKEYEIKEVAKRTLGESQLGAPVDVGGMVFRPLAHKGDTTLCLLQDLYEDSEEFKFGPDANWANSEVREMLNGDFYEGLAAIVGADNIHAMTVDLTADDGLKPYPPCEDKIALLDCQQYRQYREFIDDKPGAWQWLLTPWSGKSSRSVCIVSVDGALVRVGCGRDCTVRPLCILSSSIFVSPVKENENE